MIVIYEHERFHSFFHKHIRPVCKRFRAFPEECTYRFVGQPLVLVLNETQTIQDVSFRILLDPPQDALSVASADGKR